MDRALLVSCFGLPLLAARLRAVPLLVGVGARRDLRGSLLGSSRSLWVDQPMLRTNREATSRNLPEPLVGVKGSSGLVVEFDDVSVRELDRPGVVGVKGAPFSVRA